MLPLAQKRQKAIAYLNTVAIPYLDRDQEEYDDYDRAWDAYIREWRKLPKRPRLRKPYEGLFDKGSAGELRQKAKAVAISIRDYLLSLQNSSPSECTESDRQTDRFLRLLERLDIVDEGIEPYDGLDAIFSKIATDVAMPAQAASAEKRTGVILPEFKGGNPDATRLAIIRECDRQGLTLPTQQAYILATVEHETAGTWQPVREAFWMDEAWRKRNLWYYPYYGRGYVQITHKENYAKYGKWLGLPLEAEPDIALRPDVALFILVHGAKNGIFTGFKLEQFVHRSLTDYFNARRVINGTDRASHIATLAETWYSRITKKT